MAINFTPGQLRKTVGIGQETYRHWKKALAPLCREAGHSPCFTAGDLLATAIVRIMVIDYGVRVSALSALADPLFAKCNEQSWPSLERSLLLLDLSRKEVRLQSESIGIKVDSPAMVIPLRPQIDSLRRTLLAGDDDGGQTMFRFPPVAQPSDAACRKVSRS